MNSLSPNATRIIDEMFSLIDAGIVGCLSKQVLVRELSTIVGRYLKNRFPHLSAEQKVEVESEIGLYLESTERDELIKIIENWPKEKQPVMRSLIWILVFCFFGVVGILLLPLRWFFTLLDQVTVLVARGKKADHYQRSFYNSLCMLSTSISYQLWPNKSVECYCC